MELITKKYQFEFNKAFIPIIYDESRFKIIYGGVGSGKSYFATDYFIMRALTYKKERILVVRKNSTLNKESTFQLFKERLSYYKLLSECKINNTDLKITFKNGNEIIFKGVDDPEKIKSISGITAIFAEEATELNLTDFQQLSNRLRGKNLVRPEIFVLFNPIDMENWVYKYFFVVGKKSQKILKTNYKDNKANLDDSYMEELEDYKRTDPYRYTTDVLGEWGIRGKRVYENWETKDFNYSDVVKDLRKRKINFKQTHGLDFGYTNDPTAIVSSIVDLDNNEIWIYDAYKSSYMLYPDMYDALKKMNLLNQVIYADSAEPRSIDSLKMLGVRKITKATKHGDSGIISGTHYIKGFKIYIKSELKDVEYEFKNYEYKKNVKTELYSNTPAGGSDHYLDAFRYSVTPFMTMNTKPRTTFTLAEINA